MSPEITTQSAVLARRAIVMRSLRDSYKAWCERCCDVVLALEPDSAANVMHIPSPVLDDLLAADKLHMVEPGAKSRFICGNSISTDLATIEISIPGND